MDQANNVVDGLAMYLRVIRRYLSFVIKDEWAQPWTHLGDKHSKENQWQEPQEWKKKVQRIKRTMEGYDFRAIDKIK